MDMIRANGLDMHDGLGEVDEFVAKVILLVSLSFPYIKSLSDSISFLLYNLLGSENVAKLKNTVSAKFIFWGSVCFSYFITFEGFYDQPYRNLGTLVRLGAALSISRRSNSASCLYIPVVFKDRKLGCLTIQTRNSPSTLSIADLMRESTHVSKPDPSIGPRINIIMNMHPCLSESFIVEEDTNSVCIFILMEGQRTCFGQTLVEYPSLDWPLHSLLSPEPWKKD